MRHILLPPPVNEQSFLPRLIRAGFNTYSYFTLIISKNNHNVQIFILVCFSFIRYNNKLSSICRLNFISIVYHSYKSRKPLIVWFLQLMNLYNFIWWLYVAHFILKRYIFILLQRRGLTKFSISWRGLSLQTFNCIVVKKKYLLKIKFKQ